MLKALRRRLWRTGRDERGFTIVELLVVITVVGILAGVGISGYGNFRERANKTAADAAWRDLQVAINLYEVDTGNQFPRFHNRADDQPDNDDLVQAVAQVLSPPPEPLKNALGNPFDGIENPGTGFTVAYEYEEPEDPDSDRQSIVCVWVAGVPSQFNPEACG